MTVMWWRRAPRFVVVDTETTGFGRQDRVVEVACVTVVDGEIVDEYDTLVQVGRDLGPVHVHGITPTMLQTAPGFESVAADIAARLDGAVLVGHNLSFDARMLDQEINRLNGAAFDAGDGVCTYRMTGLKLSLAAAEAGLAMPEHTAHTALHDARVSAELLAGRGIPESGYRSAVCEVSVVSSGVTVRRTGAPTRRGSLYELAAHTAWPDTRDTAEAMYLDALDRCLDDGAFDPDERRWMDSVAAALGLGSAQRAELHSRYYDLLIAQVEADGVVSEEEYDLSQRVADALSLAPAGISPTVTGQHNLSELEPGMAVCFTGTSVINGRKIERAELERLTTGMGLVAVPSVTKKKCRLLVASDVNSRSSKADKARKWGIPIISTQEFLQRAQSNS